MVENGRVYPTTFALQAASFGQTGVLHGPVMAEMREVGEMRRILYKARSRKRWLFSNIAAWWCQCWPPRTGSPHWTVRAWHKPLGSHDLLIFPADASVPQRRYVFLPGLG